MNVTSALLLLAAVSPAYAQTATTKTATTTHHAATTAHRTTACGVTGLPVISPKVPAIPGCPKALYTLRYVDTVVGTGPLAATQKWYTVDYTGYFPDGTIFDSSKGHGPITFPYGAKKVITGFDTGFEGMHVGGKRRLFIPYELAYGEIGIPKTPSRPGNGIPPKQMLIFDVELLKMSDTPPQPPAPPTPPPTPKPATAAPTAPVAPAAPAAPTPPPPAAAKPAAVPPSANQKP
jgi:peptidylprolyl isomerase